MINRMMKVFAEKVPWERGIKIHMGEHLPNSNKISMLSEIIFKEMDEFTYSESPFFLNFTQAQELMDSLWDCGLRPSEGSGSAGALLATQNHLKDMQGLTDRLLKMVEKDG